MTLTKANQYVEKNKHKVNPIYRLKYHAMPEFGWMNDPNGLVFYRGEYHIFYQHHPYDSVWGPMHWGHMSSKDLVSFRHLPIALAPDQENETGCFSGGAIVNQKDPNQLHLFYTKHYDKNGIIIETQGLATTQDGIHFVKDEKPIIDENLIYPHGSVKDTRDPFPFYENGYYYVILGSKDNQDQGKFLIYRSKDLKNFSYYDEIVDSIMKDSMAECPDLVRFNDDDLFLFSRIDFLKNKHRNVSEYFIGHFDIENKRYDYTYQGLIDSGHHFYAPQTLRDDKNRVIMLAWMEMWGHPYVTHTLEHGWQGALTFPRELKIINQQLIQYPIEEIKNYRQKSVNLSNGIIVEKCFDLEIESLNKPFSLRLSNSNDSNNYLEIGYENSKFYIDGHKLHVNPLEKKVSKKQFNTIKLRILVDYSSIEIFINDGIETFTSRIYIESHTIKLITTGYVKGQLYPLKMEGENSHD
ncbi:MAG: GH32 C-terminal domain-containing protein [Acholeplasmataceae bacterium]|jgi:beta-fructofuranosidase|nr:GH32 C-terminal domain-containing protein [Acholeplasmataceae bacterium]